MASADRLGAALTEALNGGSGQVAVDFAEVSFLDSQGIAALVRAHQQCDFDARRLIIRSPRRLVRKVLELTGLDHRSSKSRTGRKRPPPRNL
jgi:anti-anti-sigma factor